MDYYGGTITLVPPAPELAPEPVKRTLVGGIAFNLLAFFSIFASWSITGLSFIFTGTCDGPMTGYDLSQIYDAYRQLTGVALVDAVIWVLVAALFRGRRRSAVIVGLLCCVPPVLLMLGHPSPSQWHSNFCIG